MKILIIYDSLHGNTRTIASAMGDALSKTNEVKVLTVTQANNVNLQDFEFIFFGSPTNGGQPAAPAKNFLENIREETLKGKKTAAFATGTTPDGEGFIGKTAIKIFGYAAKRTGEILKSKGATVMSTENFLVKGYVGPIVAGEIERAQKWAMSLV